MLEILHYIIKLLKRNCPNQLAVVFIYFFMFKSTSPKVSIESYKKTVYKISLSFIKQTMIFGHLL
jgi:hypothetical protein